MPRPEVDLLMMMMCLMASPTASSPVCLYVVVGSSTRSACGASRGP